ncbi:MAG: DUF1800 domain-containing protein [Rhodobacteraceae bacterium]|nr:DUF1800 domain-containing protein [Paracoccaceae bacterium]
MTFSPDLAEIRFGCGLSPVLASVQSPQAMLDGLTGADTMAVQFPIETFSEFGKRLDATRAIRRKMRKSRGTDDYETYRKQRSDLNKVARKDMVLWYGQSLLRWINTKQGFHERLAAFWADHFTTLGKSGLLRRATSPYIEDAIRPHIAGTFAEMLIASTTHPLMLHSLDQAGSIGPNSDFSKHKSPQKRGLNENLAREVLELHTLGVDGPYTQGDVRQLAELFTGLTSKGQMEFKFRKDFAEPGAETVLGKSYGGQEAQLSSVMDALQDLAVHPATARHIAWKLAVHFVSDEPDADLVDHVAARFQQTKGDLVAVYAALLEHPAAWDERLRNVKPPMDFIGSSLRALSVSTDAIETLKVKGLNQKLASPMRLMGQNWQKPQGPDGWPEKDVAWITPQGVSARLRWAMSVPQMLRPDLPDPRKFVVEALGAQAPETVQFVAASAESRADAIGLVLASPTFQRR